MNSNKKFLPLTCSLVLAGSMASAAVVADDTKNHSTMGEDKGEHLQEDVREAWMEGKLETAFLLNRHLNNFTIDAEVDGDTVVLNGTVSSDVDRDLAEQIAMNEEGIREVNNKLSIERDGKAERDEHERDFGDQVEDATLTADVKLRLLANSNTEGLSINVDTEQRVVTLQGDVESDAEKSLAEKIAANVDGVDDVVNKLKVRSQTS